MAQLGGGPLGEGEREDGVYRALLLERRAVALHQDQRLPGAGPGLEQHVTITRLDRAVLLGGRRALGARCGRLLAEP
jgi:hypothetical protein